MECGTVVVRAVITILGVSALLAGCRTTQAPGPSFGLRASRAPAMIERGRYLVQGPGHCVNCHGDPARDAEMRAGTEIPLSGGRVFDLGLAGKILAPNLTSDAETGIGALSDDTLVRSVRYGISRQGRPLAPFMSFANLADADLIAILSYLRTLPPVRHAVPANTLSWAGSFALHFVIDPQVPSTAPQARMPAARTAEYGRYLAYTVANCNGCHTKRSTLTGAFVGRPFAGGMHFEEAGGTFIAPDLRPVPNGVLDCTEQEFIARFRVPGRAQSGSPMPWNAFERMADADLGAIYAYLRSLPRG